MGEVLSASNYFVTKHNLVGVPGHPLYYSKNGLPTIVDSISNSIGNRAEDNIPVLESGESRFIMPAYLREDRREPLFDLEDTMLVEVE